MFKYPCVTPRMLMVTSQRCKDCHGPLSLTGTPITGKLPTRCPECTVWVAKRLERSQQLRALLRTSMDDKEKAAAIVATARYEIYSLGSFLSVNFAPSGWDESIGTVCFTFSQIEVHVVVNNDGI